MVVLCLLINRFVRLSQAGSLGNVDSVCNKKGLIVSGSVIYEVLLEVESSVETRFMSWLEPHVREMLTFEGFESARISRDIASTETLVRVCVEYVLADMQSFTAYESTHADRMRAEGVEVFPEGLSAKRVMWRVHGDYVSQRDT